ncbi:MAG: 30S ribosomal protein S8 [Acidobacteria bacterium]|nr:30S ribosomal protein S8 [Acidobacteriota bacterium]
MSMNDPIADLLTRIRNAQLARREAVQVAYSRLKEQILRILQEEGYIASFKTEKKEPFSVLTVLLKYGPGREPLIQHVARVSKPGRRIYAGKDEIPVVLSGIGTAILSTSKGVISDKKARQLGVGGEILCEVY